MNAAQEKIKAAAEALAQALTEGGKDYDVWAHSMDVTRLGDDDKAYAYDIRVAEKHEILIAGQR